MFDCFWLSVPVQLIAWKDSSPNDLLLRRVDVKPNTLTHSVISLFQCVVLPGIYESGLPSWGLPSWGFPSINQQLLRLGAAHITAGYANVTAHVGRPLRYAVLISRRGNNNTSSNSDCQWVVLEWRGDHWYGP